MKDTIKNSIIGVFAIFGFITLISSSNTVPTIVQGTKLQIYDVVAGGGASTGAYRINKETGDTWYINNTKAKPVRFRGE